MKEHILNKVTDAGSNFASDNEDDELDEETLRDAIMTGHVTPDELGEAFVCSVLDNLGLENTLAQRRADRIEAIQAEMVRSFEEGLLEGRASKRDIRALAERFVDAIHKS